MSTVDDDVSPGINGRLRPRKSNVSSPKLKSLRKSEARSASEKAKSITTPPKTLLNIPDDLSNKSECTSVIDVLCPYCDKKFISKQAVSKHTRRTHLTTKHCTPLHCIYCSHIEAEAVDIIRHMIDTHSDEYFACLDCYARFPTTTELTEHQLNDCEKLKLSYKNKLRQKLPRKNRKVRNAVAQKSLSDENRRGFNGVVISCELKPAHGLDDNDIEDKITTNLILPSNKNLVNTRVIDKNAVIILDDLQWNKRIPHNFSFHNTDADQILSRLGVVHRSPRTAESTRKDWFKAIDEPTQKFERCFDTGFYSRVASNVQENLAKFLDGSFNFNPDPDKTIKTRKAKNSVPINTVEGFPILLACEQYSRNIFDGYMPRAIAPKHKWKWESTEERHLLNPDQIKRDNHVNNCIVTLVSSLDIWTQLCMRRKFEEKYKCTPLEKSVVKQNLIGLELKEILESRELPSSSSSSSNIVRNCNPTSSSHDSYGFPASLGLSPAVPKYEVKQSVLSGEWVRPRCFVCCACGFQTTDSRGLTSHMSTKHPNAQVQYYEIVGELLLNSDILKHLYVPPSQIHNKTRPLRGFRECTKCNKSITLEDLHQHMLDCAGDLPTVRRKCRYRPFGVRKRKTRLPDGRICKKIRKNIHRQDIHSIRRQSDRPRPKIRSEVGDAETIRKMLADLPAKRHRVMVNTLNPMLRSATKIKQRNKLVLKQRKVEETKTTNYDPGSASHEDVKIVNHTMHGIKEQDKNRNFKTMTRVRRRISNCKDILTKHNPNRLRSRKLARSKEILESVSPTEIKDDDQPASVIVSSNQFKIDQLVTEASSSRVNVNSGPNNTREQSNRSNDNGSNNRDNQNPEQNDNNGNNREQGAPNQNIPLKHSIARLTADTETQDKAVQFHHLFLVQQECNNVTQHDPSGQPVLFEKKAVATKLDKPPLSVDTKEDKMEKHNNKNNKLNNKSRKGLNDCIAMLKNKLVEPLKSPEVSIQCEIEKYEMESISKQMPDLSVKQIDKTSQCLDNTKKSPLKSVSPSLNKNITKDSMVTVIPNKKLVRIENSQEQKINTPKLTVQQITESSKCSSVVDNKKQFKNDLTGTKLRNKKNKVLTADHVSDLNKNNITLAKIQIHSDNNNVCNDIHNKSRYRNDANKVYCSQLNIKDHPKKIIPPQPRVISKVHEKQELILNSSRSQVITTTKVSESLLLVSHSKPTHIENEQIRRQNIYSASELPLQGGSIVEPSLTPLDLSEKPYINHVIAHCSSQMLDTITPIANNTITNTLETLDLSQKGFYKGQDYGIPYTEEVVDLSVKVVKPLNIPSSSAAPENTNCDSSDFATDLSLKHGDENCLPTDLSLKGKFVSNCSYRSQNRSETQHIDVVNSGPPSVCLNLTAKSTDEDIPTDLSKRAISKVVDSHCVSSSYKTPYTNASMSNVTVNLNTPDHTNGQCFYKQQVSNKLQALLSYKSNESTTINDLISNKINQPKPASVEPRYDNVYGAIQQKRNTYLNEELRSEIGLTMGLSKPNSSTYTDQNQYESNQQMHFYNTSKTIGEVNMQNNTVIHDLKKTQAIVTTPLQQSKPSPADYSVTKKRMERSVSVIKQDTSKLVCTVKNKCSPVSKESSHSTNITNAFLSSANLTNCNLSSVYTSAGTSKTGTCNFMPYTQKVHNSATNARRDIIVLEERQSHVPLSTNKLAEVERDDIVKIKNICNDHDAETAKKIAMLPQEIVDILGNVPKVQFNQLLNVLPNYVSTSTTLSSPKNLKEKDQNGPGVDMSDYPKHLPKQTLECNKTLFDGEEIIKPPVDDYMKSSQLLHEGRTHSVNISIPTKENIVSDVTKITKHTSLDGTSFSSDIIDLTDDCVDISTNLNSIAVSSSNEHKLTISKPTSQKTINEKTASLRAVRIKTPSERHKEIMKTEININKTFQENNNDIKLLNLDNQSNQAKKEEECVNTSIIESLAVPETDKEKSRVNQDIKKNTDIVAKTSSNLQIDPITTLSTSAAVVKSRENNDYKTCDEDRLILKPSSSLSGLVSKDNNEDEDSEDDVSLAIIVKQKQSDEIKTINIVNNNNIQVNDLVDDNNEKNDMVVRNSSKSNVKETADADNLLPQSVSTLTENISKESLFSIEDGDPKKLSSQQNRNKMIKQQNISHRNKIVGPIEHMSEFENASKYIKGCSIELQSEPDKLQIHNIVSNEGIISKHAVDENDYNRVEKAQSKSNFKVINNKQGCDTVNNEPDKQHACNTVSNEGIIIKHAVDVNDYNIVEKDTVRNYKVKEGQSLLKNAVKNDKQECIGKTYDKIEAEMKRDKFNSKHENSENISSGADLSIETKMKININETIPQYAKNIENEMNTKNLTVEVEKPVASDNVQATTSSDSHFNQNNMTSHGQNTKVMPLRRSRRGKSLFVDSSEVSADINIKLDNVERTPFTKKQLIFSKLLLDGETKETKQPTNDIVAEITNSLDNKNDIISGAEKSIAGNIEEYQTLSKKSRKRKQSPQIIKDGKRNKSDRKQVPAESINSSSITSSAVNEKESTELVERVTENVVYEVQCKRINEDHGFLDKSNEFNEQSSKKLKNINECNEHLKELVKVDKSVETDCLENDAILYKTKTKNTDSDSNLKICQQNDSDISTLSEKRKSSNKNYKHLYNNDEKNTISTADNPEKVGSSECEEISRCSKMHNNNKNKHVVLEEENISEVLTPTQNECKISTEVEKNVHNVQFCERIPPKNLTCYNKPAMRKGRSKSVFIKSSEFYDPYDINLEDMAESTVPSMKKGFSKNFGTKKGKKKSTSENDNIPSTSKLTKCNDKKININNQSLQVETIIDTKGTISDSDDSSKSDIPLKKIVEEKQRKCTSKENQDNIKKKDYDVKKKRKDTLCTNLERKRNSLLEENERLRSEKFMESFGFFSERKPRKSNLLASKKISETFHNIASDNDEGHCSQKNKYLKKSMQNGSSSMAAGRKDLKRGKQKKKSPVMLTTYCEECRKDFGRPDNFLRHQMLLAHALKISELDLNFKMMMTPESVPNFLIAVKQQMQILKKIQRKIKKKKKYCKNLERIPVPSLYKIIVDITQKIRQSQLAPRELSRDEALFLDCCELLNGSHKEDGQIADRSSAVNRHCVGSDPHCCSCNKITADCLDLFEKQVNDCLQGKLDDADLDSIAAQNIMESEEVRNLENDLISGLKEAACANYPGTKMDFSKALDLKSTQNQYNVVYSKDKINNPEFTTSSMKVHEVKEKMYPDVIEDIDMFEDKFDKIKRKCRSQAAAVKQNQYVADVPISCKSKKKSEKRKGKKHLKKSLQMPVPTKGALKGYDGVRVSISTTNINISSIIPPIITSKKKKKRSNSKRKRDRKLSQAKYDLDSKNIKNTSQKKLDVYEFMDNEDVELFELRPSTLMERFKNISKDKKITSKSEIPVEEPEESSESVSDGDDFVYMSDDYVCSDAETENSLMSCELSSAKLTNDTKKTIPFVRRKETTEKNAVMGKIFKNNAVRSEKRVSITKESVKPKANLDQLFDSLLEDEPNSSTLANCSLSPKSHNDDHIVIRKPEDDIKKQSDIVETYDKEYLDRSKTKKDRSPSPIPLPMTVYKSKTGTSVSPMRKLSISHDESDYSSHAEHRKHANKKKSDHNTSKSKEALNHCHYDLNKDLTARRKSKKSKHITIYKQTNLEHKSKKKSKEDLSSNSNESDSSVNRDDSLLDNNNYDGIFIKPKSREKVLLNPHFKDDIKSSFCNKNKQKTQYLKEKYPEEGSLPIHNSDDGSAISTTPLKISKNHHKSSITKDSDDILSHRKRKSCEGDSVRMVNKLSKKDIINDEITSDDADKHNKHKLKSSDEPHDFYSRKRMSREYEFKSEDSLFDDDDEELYTKHKMKGNKSGFDLLYEDTYKRNKTKESRSKMQSSYDDSLLKESSLSPNERDFTVRKRDLRDKESSEKILLDEGIVYRKPKSKDDLRRSDEIKQTGFEFKESMFDSTVDAGVATQRARRNCTLGKQNILAETWSSESEPDGIPPRPSSAESTFIGLGRKKKGRKKDGSHRKGSRQNSTKRNETDSRSYHSRSEGIVPMTRPSAISVKPKPRATSNYWSDDEQERVEQHGWIVGDSHKKLVTMLAHAKGKRNHDDRRHFVD
ncbi:uncharacterized protein LOC126978382 [Leptidea sinapis]|uniref:uncharacterized protein LOC126978382 n=1 Tax=Leptidea sinapis TaxID=189913 RepID=UPI0021464DE1|nr:uncharacterized protein LOC126978382 [Leptidea sinapis]